MHKLLSLALALPMVACVVGSDTGPSGGGGAGGGGGGGTGGGGGGGTAAGDHITTDTTWTGTVDVAKTTTVDKGVTLTIAAGTTVRFASSASITIQGIVDIQGTKAQVVNLSPSAAGAHYPGFTISTGGELKMNYAVQVGGEILVDGGKITAINSRMSQASHDLLVVNSGTVDVSYSAIGLEPGAGTDTTHCDMHFGGAGSSIKVTHSNISSSVYGLMFYGGKNVDLTYNNWFNNPTQIDTVSEISGDISNSWFDNGAPKPVTGATLTNNNPSGTRLPANMAGPQ